MKAIIKDLAINITVDDVVVTGQFDTSLATFIHCNTSEKNVDVFELLKVKQAGFDFDIRNGRCYFT